MNRIIKHYPIVLAIFLDGITIGIIFTLLNSYILEPKTSLLALNTTPVQRELIYSSTLTFYMLSWAWGNALVGSLSDIYGRKLALTITMTGKAIGFALAIIAVQQHSFLIFLISRFIDGITNGTQPQAEAIGVDLSPSTSLRATFIGYMLLPITAGDFLGNYILEHLDLLHWLGKNPAIRPLSFGCILSIITLLIILFFFKETIKTKPCDTQRKKITFLYPIQILTEAFYDKSIRKLSIIMLLTVLGWSIFFNYLGDYISHYFNLTANHLAVLFAVISVGFCLSLLFMVRLTHKFSQPTNIFMLFKSLVAAVIITLVFIHNDALLWCLMILAGLFNITAYVTLLGLLSNAVSDERQGWIMGISGALHFLGFALSGVVAMMLIHFSMHVLFLIAAIFIITSVILMHNYKLFMINKQVDSAS